MLVWFGKETIFLAILVFVISKRLDTVEKETGQSNPLKELHCFSFELVVA